MNHTTVVEEIRFPSGEFDLYGRLRRRGTPAPTMLLLCGIGFHTFEYEPLAGQLADRGISSFSFDYRGHGRSTGRRGTWRLADLVRDTSAAIDALHKGRPRSVHVFGNSLGAMVAILAGTYDARVGAVAACNAPAHVADFTLNRPRRILFAAAKAAVRVAPLRLSLNHFYSYAQLIADPARVTAIEHDPLIGPARRLAIGTYRELLEGWDGPAAVRDLHRPLLLLQGRNDRLQPVRQAELLAVAANEPADYRLLDTGHLPHLEDPVGLAQLLTDWALRPT